MKWAIIGIVAVVVLGGAGYAVYELTDWFEQGQDWWDEKKLDNFETHANRELDAFEKKIAEHEKTLREMKVDRVMWAGDETLGERNFKEGDNGFWTKYGYDEHIKYRENQGKALAAAYKKAAAATDASIDTATGELDAETVISVDLPDRKGVVSTKELKASELLSILGEIEEDLIDKEANLARVEDMVAQFDTSIKAWEKQIETEKSELKDLRKEVKTIAAEIKLQKAKEDLAELNKAINGKESDSELGKMIHQFETKKARFQAEELVAADEGKKGGGSVTLADLDKPTSKKAPAKSRFLK